MTFITFEGPEGCGKTTQSKMFAEFLKTSGLDVLYTREPGGTPIGEQIRKVLMALDNTAMDPRAEALLFSAARAQLVHQVIKPHLDQGGVVVSDRYYDSTLAYQGYGLQQDLEALRQVTRFATSELIPDLTLLVDVPVEIGLERKQQGKEWNRLDAYALEIHKRVRQGYLELAKAEPERWVVIDGCASPEEVEASIHSVVKERLGELLFT
jgi:dTMP kinase